MTSSVKVTAHCGPNKEVVFSIREAEGHPDTSVTVLQDGESAEKYIYDGRIAYALERVKDATTLQPPPL